MARYSTSFHSPKSPDEVFIYLADFSNAPGWDANTVSSELLTQDPYQVGAKYEVVTGFAGREMTLTYETLEIERPSRVVLEASNGVARIRDTMTFTPSGTGSRIEYDANISMSGIAKVLDPVFSLIFKRVGDRAAASMRKALGAA